MFKETSPYQYKNAKLGLLIAEEDNINYLGKCNTDNMKLYNEMIRMHAHTRPIT